MNNLQIFSNETFGMMRTIVENDIVLFCGSDVAKALGYSRPTKAIQDHCRGVLKRDIIDSLGRTQSAGFVSEGDLYRLIVGSKLPTAEKFERWMFDEVLPTIRETGGYVANEEMFVEQYFPEADPALKLVLSTALKDKKRYMAQLRAQRPLVEFAETIQTSEDNILMGTLAKLICNSGIKIGAKRLFRLLRDEKILMENNVPYQHYIDQGYFVVKESAYTLSCDTVKLKPTTLITPKGQVWVVNRVRKALGE